MSEEIALQQKQLQSTITDLHNQIQEGCDNIQDLMKHTACLAWKVGEQLVKGKPMLGHGNWGVFLSTLPFSKTTAHRYEALYKAVTYQELEQSGLGKIAAYKKHGIVSEPQSEKQQTLTGITQEFKYLTYVNNLISEFKDDDVINQVKQTDIIELYKKLSEIISSKGWDMNDS